MTFRKQGEGFFIGTASSEVPDIERGDLEQALKKAPLFLAIIFSNFCVFLTEQWSHEGHRLFENWHTPELINNRVSSPSIG